MYLSASVVQITCSMGANAKSISEMQAFELGVNKKPDDPSLL